MNANLKSDRSAAVSQASVTRFHGNVSRQAGNIRAVTLEGRNVVAGPGFCASSAVQESIEDTFGKTPEIKGKIQNAFAGTHATTTNSWE